jgi:hypothetical protein
VVRGVEILAFSYPTRVAGSIPFGFVQSRFEISGFTVGAGHCVMVAGQQPRIGARHPRLMLGACGRGRCRDAGPQSHQKLNKGFGPTRLWETVYRFANTAVPLGTNSGPLPAFFDQ